MGKAKQDSVAAQSGRKKKRTAYLVAVRRTGEATCVYAVVAYSAKMALAQVMEQMVGPGESEVVGALSRDLTRRLGLKPDQSLRI